MDDMTGRNGEPAKKGKGEEIIKKRREWEGMSNERRIKQKRERQSNKRRR